MMYMIDQIVVAYETLLIFSLSYCVCGHISLKSLCHVTLKETLSFMLS